MAQVTAFRVF